MRTIRGHELRRSILFTLACIAAPTGSPLTAQSIDLLSIDAARFGSSWTLNGMAMESTRQKLLSPGNFGIGGVVGTPIVITDTAATIDAGLLAGSDVVFIGYLFDGSPNAFSVDELDALHAWVELGGGILITCDEASYDAVCERFGVPVSGGGQTLVSASGAGFNHPALVGPFGSVRQVAASGAIATFDESSVASELMRNDANGRPIVMARELGEGRVVFLGDIDMISDYTLQPDSSILRPNDVLLGNAIAWLAGESGSSPCVPSDTTLCIHDAPGDGRFRVRVRYDTVLGGGRAGEALATPLGGVGAEKGGLFTFFDPAVPEMLLKVLNGCGLTDHHWVFFSAGTNAGFEVVIEDRVRGGAPYVYVNPDLMAAPPVQDIYALPCS